MRSGGPPGSPPVYTIVATFQMPDFSTFSIGDDPPISLYVSSHLGEPKALDMLEQLLEKENSECESPNETWIIFRGIVTWDAWQLVQEIARESWSLRFRWPM